MVRFLLTPLEREGSYGAVAIEEALPFRISHLPPHLVKWDSNPTFAKGHQIMAFDISSIKAKPAATPTRVSTRTKKDLGPNIWLDKNWDNSLQSSYDNDEAYAADFKGKIEALPAKRGKNKGEPVDKVTGEAADAIYLIREAAKILGVGVAIRYQTAARNGYVNVVWHGRTPKQTAKFKGETPASPPAVDSPLVTE